MTHPTHKTRLSDSSLYDEVCTKCGATDADPGEPLRKPCTAHVPVHAIGDAAVAAVDAAINNAVESVIDPVAPRRYPVYVASKINHFGMWKELRRKWRGRGIDIISSWIDNIDPVHGDANVTPLRFAGAWIENYREVTAAKCVICYGESGDVLRGALIETGIAMGQHKPIIIVGPEDLPSWGSWQYHPLVTYARSLDYARTIIETWLGRARTEESPS